MILGRDLGLRPLTNERPGVFCVDLGGTWGSRAAAGYPVGRRPADTEA